MWVYKSKDKLQDKPAPTSVLPICPKCHYVLLIREGEKPAFCPMCGYKNESVKKEKK